MNLIYKRLLSNRLFGKEITTNNLQRSTFASSRAQRRSANHYKPTDYRQMLHKL